MDEELLSFGIWVRHEALPRAHRRALVDEMRSAPHAATEVFLYAEQSYVVAEEVRSVRTVQVSPEARADVERWLASLLPELSAFFDEDLVAFEPVQFLRYEPGDHFVAHRDADDYEPRHRARKVSIVTYLNSQDPDPTTADGFGGGELLLMVFGDDPRARELGIPAAPIAGTTVAFRSSLVHEVRPVEHGSRFTLVTWARTAEPFDDAPSPSA